MRGPTEAVDLVASKLDADGRWAAEPPYPGRMPVAVDAAPGSPSRWITLRAWRVLRWTAGRTETEA